LAERILPRDAEDAERRDAESCVAHNGSHSASRVNHSKNVVSIGGKG
jgi:hypothetical protein